MAYTSSAQLANVHEDGVWAVAWSPNGQVVTGSCDELVQTYTVHGQDIQKKHQLRGHQLGVCSVSVSEGGLAASSALDSHIRLWDLESGAERGVIDAGPVEAWTVSLSPDGRLVASGSQGGNINLWNVEVGEKQHTFEEGANQSRFRSKRLRFNQKCFKAVHMQVGRLPRRFLLKAVRNHLEQETPWKTSSD